MNSDKPTKHIQEALPIGPSSQSSSLSKLEGEGKAIAVLERIEGNTDQLIKAFNKGVAIQPATLEKIRKPRKMPERDPKTGAFVKKKDSEEKTVQKAQKISDDKDEKREAGRFEKLIQAVKGKNPEDAPAFQINDTTRDGADSAGLATMGPLWAAAKEIKDAATQSFVSSQTAVTKAFAGFKKVSSIFGKNQTNDTDPSEEKKKNKPFLSSLRSILKQDIRKPEKKAEIKETKLSKKQHKELIKEVDENGGGGGSTEDSSFLGSMLSSVMGIGAGTAAATGGASGLSGMGKSGLGIAGKALSKMALPLTALVAGLTAFSKVQADDSLSTGQKAVQVGATTVGATGGAVAGGLAGATAGAVIGSVVPVIGTTIGAAIGGLGGAILGSMGGESIGTGVGQGVSDFMGRDTSSNKPTVKTRRGRRAKTGSAQQAQKDGISTIENKAPVGTTPAPTSTSDNYSKVSKSKPQVRAVASMGKMETQSKMTVPVSNVAQLNAKKVREIPAANAKVKEEKQDKWKPNLNQPTSLNEKVLARELGGVINNEIRKHTISNSKVARRMTSKIPSEIGSTIHKLMQRGHL